MAVYCDFDGTIALRDVTDAILGRLADPAWERVEAQWLGGEINARECMARQVPLIRGGWSAIKAVLADIKLDPSFAPFAMWCASEGIPLRVVSDGLDKVINYLLWRDEISVSGVWANHLNSTSDDRLFLTCPPEPPSGECESGVCKCHVMDQTGGSDSFSIVIGDGKSDFCWVKQADMVFAKSKLQDHCRANRIACTPFGDFTTIQTALFRRPFAGSRSAITLPQTASCTCP